MQLSIITKEQKEKGNLKEYFLYEKSIHKRIWSINIQEEEKNNIV